MLFIDVVLCRYLLTCTNEQVISVISNTKFFLTVFTQYFYTRILNPSHCFSNGEGTFQYCYDASVLAASTCRHLHLPSSHSYTLSMFLLSCVP